MEGYHRIPSLHYIKANQNRQKLKAARDEDYDAISEEVEEDMGGLSQTRCQTILRSRTQNSEDNVGTAAGKL